MIIIDFSQVVIGNIMSQMKYNPVGQLTHHTNLNGEQYTIKHDSLNEDLIRHMALTSILSFKKRFGKEYGQIILCTDDKNYWRKSIFAYYKANRKKARESSKLNWKVIFDTLNKLKAELKENFPYKVLQVERAEADDIIGTICMKYGETSDDFFEPKEKILIISGDNDFLQLQKYSNVSQYSPVLKKFIKTNNPQKTLMEHIIYGDDGDGIPNFLTKDDVFLDDNARQKSIMKKKLAEWLKCEKPEDFCDEDMMRGFKRNQQLIDLSFTPEHIQKVILEDFSKEPEGKGKRLLPYFMKHQLKLLINAIGEF